MDNSGKPLVLSTIAVFTLHSFLSKKKEKRKNNKKKLGPGSERKDLLGKRNYNNKFWAYCSFFRSHQAIYHPAINICSNIRAY